MPHFGVASLVLVALLVAGCGASPTPSVLSLSRSDDAHPLMGHLAVLVDTTGLIDTPEEAERHAFVPVEAGSSASDRPVWLRIEIEAPAVGNWYLSTAPPYERGELFQKIEGKWVGSRLPAYDAALAMPLSLGPGRQTLYLRLAGLSTPPPIFQIATMRGHEMAEQRLLLVQGLYFGAVLLTILLNLTVLRLRERAHLFYVVFVALTAAFFFLRMGLFSRFVLPSVDRTDLLRPEILCLVLSAGAAALFSREFLSTARLAPRMDLVLRGYLLLVAVVAVAVVVRPANYSIAWYVGIALPFLAIGAGIAALRGRSRWATTYLVAWSFYALGVLILTLPMPSLGWSSNAFYQAGSAIEIVLLSRALVLRLRVLRDERRSAEERAARAERLAMIGHMAAGVVHEVNNPNNLVTFNLPILRDYLGEVAPFVREAQRLDPERRFCGLTGEAFIEDANAMIAQMLHGSERITGIVAGLKSYVGVAPTPQRWEPGNLNEIVARAAATMTKTASLGPEELVLRLAGDLPIFCLVPARVEQVVVNLLENAVHATEEVPKRRIVIRTRCEPGWASLEVVDNGHGIPESIRRRIFEPFFTTRAGSRGVGLGLAISDEIARDHGGGIEVDVDPDGHTRFVVRLGTNREVSE